MKRQRAPAYSKAPIGSGLSSVMQAPVSAARAANSLELTDRPFGRPLAVRYVIGPFSGMIMSEAPSLIASSSGCMQTQKSAGHSWVPAASSVGVGAWLVMGAGSMRRGLNRVRALCVLVLNLHGILVVRAGDLGRCGLDRDRRNGGIGRSVIAICGGGDGDRVGALAREGDGLSRA